MTPSKYLYKDDMLDKNIVEINKCVDNSKEVERQQ